MRAEEWSRWKMETENQARGVSEEYGRLLEEKSKLRAAAAGDGAPDEAEEEDEDVVRPKKRARAEETKPRLPVVRKPRTSVTSTTSQTSSSSSAATAAFYSFGLAYVLFPRATEWLGYRPDVAVQSNTTRGKVLLPLDTPVALPTGGWLAGVFDVLGFLALGLVIMACVYALTRKRSDQGDEVPTDEESEESVETEQVAVHRLGRRLALGTARGIVSEVVQRLPFLREESISPSASRDWYKVLSAHVGGGESLALYIRLPALTLLQASSLVDWRLCISGSASLEQPTTNGRLRCFTPCRARTRLVRPHGPRRRNSSTRTTLVRFKTSVRSPCPRLNDGCIKSNRRCVPSRISRISSY